jgi:prepilin-type N-terminal cleavage/methylation domain-containing protein/prepilin-type processing-associated H-X9-DG protein
VHKSYRSAGFTLVELLVVIAIIGILVALLLPAIQSAREAARRTQCTNNIRQLALALHNHHDARKQFPLGAIWLAKSTPSPDGRHPNWGATWVTMVLPQFEEGNLYDRYDFSKAARHPVNAAVTSLRIATLICPSADPLALNLTEAGGSFAKGNYGANYSADDCMSFVDWDTEFSRGIFAPVRQQHVRFKDLKDGTTKTVLLSEILGSDALDDGRGAWGHVVGPAFSGNGNFFCNPDGDRCRFNGPTNQFLTPNSSRYPDHPPHCGGPLATRFCVDERSEITHIGARSRHPGGVNVAMADSSVRFIDDAIQPQIWYSLLSTKAGELVAGDF